MSRAALAFAVMLVAASSGASIAADEIEDRNAGYYYPPVTSEETFARVIAAAPEAEAAVRVNFVTSITKAQLAAPESPR
ncbi:MAG: hypothetical protein WD969_07410, partial [Paracoccaceae bacterium]